MLAFGSNEIELGKYTSNDCVVCAMANVGDGLFSESCFDCMVTWCESGCRCVKCYLQIAY